MRRVRKLVEAAERVTLSVVMDLAVRVLEWQLTRMQRRRKRTGGGAPT